MIPSTVQVAVRVPKAACESCVLFPKICFSHSPQMMNHFGHKISSLWGFSSLNPISFTPRAINQVTDAYPQLSGETSFISSNCVCFSFCLSPSLKCVYFPNTSHCSQLLSQHTCSCKHTCKRILFLYPGALL